MTKICFVCKKEKPLEEFYKHKAMSSGYLNKCKECTREYMNKHRLENLERIREYDRNRPNKAERTQKLKDYKERMRRENPEKYDKIYHEARKRYRAKYNEKARATDKVHYAVKHNKIQKPNVCSRCNKTCTPQAHHYDYTKPLDVIWLCEKCHAEIHVALRKEKE